MICFKFMDFRLVWQRRLGPPQRLCIQNLSRRPRHEARGTSPSCLATRRLPQFERTFSFLFRAPAPCGQSTRSGVAAGLTKQCIWILIGRHSWTASSGSSLPMLTSNIRPIFCCSRRSFGAILPCSEAERLAARPRNPDRRSFLEMLPYQRFVALRQSCVLNFDASPGSDPFGPLVHPASIQI